MKIFKAILKIVGVLFLLLVLVIVALEIYASIDRQDTFYLKNAEFSNFNYLYDLDKKTESNDEIASLSKELNVYVHRLSKGNGLILAYRFYTNGTTAIDDEGFTKITIWLANIPESFPATFDFSSKQSVRAAYSTGGSAWPRHACSGYIESGTVSLRKKDYSYIVKIKGTVYPAGSSSIKDHCEQQEIDYEFTASELQFSDLTPWLGLKGDHPYAETYR